MKVFNKISNFKQNMTTYLRRSLQLQGDSVPAGPLTPSCGDLIRRPNPHQGLCPIGLLNWGKPPDPMHPEAKTKVGAYVCT